MDFELFSQRVDYLMTIGYSEEDAARLVELAGDICELAPDGKQIVRDETGKEVARLDLF